jgi:hypothetical protein
MRFFKRFVLPKQRKPMTHFRMRMPLLVATVVAASILGAPSKVNAGFDLQVNTGSGYGDVPGYPTSGNGTVTFDGFTIKVTTTILPIMTTFDLEITATNPTVIPSISFEGIWNANTPGIQAYMYGFSGTFGTISTSISNGYTTGPLPVTPTQPQSGFTPEFASSGYTLSTIISFDSTGSAVAFDSSNIVFNTPAPGGLLLALTGLPLFGLRAWRNRKASETQTTEGSGLLQQAAV